MNEPEDPEYEDKDNSEDSELYDSIHELENLIANRATNVNSHADQSIPVLDDLVGPDDLEFDDLTGPGPEEMTDSQTQNIITSEQLHQIIGSMDEKLSGELDELVNILKDAIKESIITEIKTRFENEINDQPPKDSGEEDTQL